jgi:hypothetical protein
LAGSVKTRSAAAAGAAANDKTTSHPNPRCQQAIVALPSN